MTDKATAITKRGRPPNGERPMTASERKRAQRTRDKRAVIDAIGDEQDAPLRALLVILGRNRPAVWFRECHQKAEH